MAVVADPEKRVSIDLNCDRVWHSAYGNNIYKMSALVDYDSDSGSSSNADSVDGQTTTDEPAVGSKRPRSTQTSLPSVADALSRQDAPSFLAPVMGGKAIVDYAAQSSAVAQASMTREIAEAAEAAAIAAAEAERERKLAPAPSVPVAPPASSSAGSAQSATSRMKAAAQDGVGPAKNNADRAARERERERLTQKDRMKHQRLSGQSGIGEDFTTWRSDEEMALRQHFDS